MGFFRNIFGKPAAAAATSPALIPPATPSSPYTAAPTAGQPVRRISYDPKLVESLLHDHAELGRIFANVGEAQKNGNFGDLRPLLIQFKTRLEAHVLTENVRFYNYLEQSLSGDAADSGTMHSFRREMNGIARSVVDFVKKYQSSDFTPGARRQFAADYEMVGKILEQRLDSEENNLYPLYMPN